MSYTTSYNTSHQLAMINNELKEDNELLNKLLHDELYFAEKYVKCHISRCKARAHPHDDAQRPALGDRKGHRVDVTVVFLNKLLRSENMRLSEAVQKKIDEVDEDAVHEGLKKLGLL